MEFTRETTVLPTDYVIEILSNGEPVSAGLAEEFKDTTFFYVYKNKIGAFNNTGFYVYKNSKLIRNSGNVSGSYQLDELKRLLQSEKKKLTVVHKCPGCKD